MLHPNEHDGKLCPGAPCLGLAGPLPLFSGVAPRFLRHPPTLMTSPVLVLFSLLKCLLPLSPCSRIPSFSLPLQSPAPLELVSSSHHASFPRQDATRPARPVNHHASTWTLSTRSESIYVHSYARLVYRFPAPSLYNGLSH